MKPDEAERLLGLLECEATSLRSVRAAFARRVRECHPDTTPGATAERPLIRDLQMARDVLIERIASQNNACVLCSGRGKVRAGMGWRRCGACDGTGDRV
jgi:hypothetical protein